MDINEKLPQMQSANLPRFDWRSIVESGADQLGDDDTKALDEYFVQFTPKIDNKCPCCQSSFGDNGIASFLLAGAIGHTTLEWGLANGEAFCVTCGWPYRVYHRNVGPIRQLNYALPYHPDELSVEVEN